MSISNEIKRQVSKIRLSVEQITPEAAKRMLGSNTSNQRNINKTNLKKIERCIDSDLYVLNGESLIISETGKILDGQHTLTGVLNTGKSIYKVVVRGVEDLTCPP